MSERVSSPLTIAASAYLVANLLHGADIAYYVGMLVAGVLYYVLRRASNAATDVEPEQSS